MHLNYCSSKDVCAAGIKNEVSSWEKCLRIGRECLATGDGTEGERRT